MFLSFIIPCYNSERTISLVVDEIESELIKLDIHNYEIVLINDNSPDNVFAVIKQLCIENKHIKAISLARNFGQHAAIMAGMRSAYGDIFVFLDDDGQIDVSDLNNLLCALDDDCDAVFGKYIEKKHSFFKKFGSRVNALMAEALIGKPKALYVSSFYACKKYVAEEIVKYEGTYPYLLGLFLRTTNKIKNVDIRHRERLYGKTGYTLRKMLSLWLNGFTAFSVKPLRIATATGAIFALFGFIVGAATIINKLLNPNVPIGYSSMMAALTFIGGVIMLMLGMIGEYIGRIYISINKAPQYVIRETVNLEEDKSRGCE